MDILEKIQSNILLFDGAMGTVLQERGLGAGELPELWNLTHPSVVQEIHEEYLRAGADILKTNTFGANPLKMENYAEVIKAAVGIAKKARAACVDLCKDIYIAFDMGPLGKMLQPFGDLPFEEAVSLFADAVRVAYNAGVDLVLIETMNDSYETKAAVLAVKENTELPLFVTNAYDENGRLLTGADASAMVALLEGLGVDGLGVNCSLGPRQLSPIVKTMLEMTSLPVIVNPNAGLPRTQDGRTVFDIAPEEFAEEMRTLAVMGAAAVGGCCGTTPLYIRLVKEALAGAPRTKLTPVPKTLVSSHALAVEIGERPVLIGERINPTGKKKFKEALRSFDLDYIIKEGLSQEERGAHILDVNVGLPEIDECAVMTRVISELQALTALPLQIDTADVQTMASAMRLYNGKPLVNSVNGKAESMAAIFPLVSKYGGVVIALTLDEDGIPPTAEGRLRIAERIVTVAKKHGIDKKDIVIDPLAMAISADKGSALETLRAIRMIREKLGVHTSLGVSNISFGLPERETLNASFFAMALEAGLSLAIVNPHSDAMMRAYYAALALRGQDDNFERYIANVSVQVADAPKTTPNFDINLENAIVKGMKESASQEATVLLGRMAPLDVVQKAIVPALDLVGQGFEKGTVYLPQLLLAAEAAKAAFEAVRQCMAQSGAVRRNDSKIILATVQGDIHDIGKNIVKVLLINYGFEVLDLGKDVPPETICEAVLKHDVTLVGLSALMTTTVPAMEKTIRLLRSRAPKVRIMVGGAVLTEEYARSIGADFYGKDAMQSVRYAERIFDEKQTAY